MGDELSREKEVEIIRHFGKHIVSLSGMSVLLDESGMPKGEETFFNYSCCVLSVKDAWWIVTAGHIFEEIEQPLARKQVAVTQQYLVDYFGIEADDPHPIPFNFLGMEKVWRYEDGLDFAVIPLDAYHRRLLSGGHIVPLDERAYSLPSDIDFYQFRILGCPKHLTKSDRLSSTEPIMGRVKPLFPVVSEASVDETYKYPRFKGRVQEGLASVVGLSGGPILGLAMYKNQHIYSLVAIQSGWFERTREVFGCPVSVFIPLAEQMLAEQRRQPPPDAP